MPKRSKESVDRSSDALRQCEQVHAEVCKILRSEDEDLLLVETEKLLGLLDKYRELKETLEKLEYDTSHDSGTIWKDMSIAGEVIYKSAKHWGLLPANDESEDDESEDDEADFPLWKKPKCGEEQQQQSPSYCETEEQELAKEKEQARLDREYEAKRAEQNEDPAYSRSSPFYGNVGITPAATPQGSPRSRSPGWSPIADEDDDTLQ